MSHPHRHPLDLPEIQHYLARFLRRRDLLVCARVSRAWHNVFAPWLWRKLKIASNRFSTFTGESRPIVNHMSELALHKYSAFIQQLACDGNDKWYLDSLSCPHLRDLILSWEGAAQWSFVLRHCESLQSLTFCSPVSRYPDQGLDFAFWSAACSCPSLHSLTAVGVCVRLQDWPICWGIWSRLTHLSMVELYIQTDPSSLTSRAGMVTLHAPTAMDLFKTALGKTAITSTIKTLEMRNLNGLSCWEDELLFLEWFPDLESLDWDPRAGGEQTTSIGESLAKSLRHCPRLSSLTIAFDPKEEVEGILPFLSTRAGMPLESLRLRGSWFGKDSWRLIKAHHWKTIRILELNQYSQQWINGAMVQDMMCSLPALTSLKAPWIEDRDIMEDPRPWVCSGLTHLYVSFGLVLEDTSLSQKIIFGRIGRLTSLRHWNLSRMIYDYHFAHMNGVKFLKFRLEDGLESLGPLKQLERLSFSIDTPEIGEAEVRWMLKHWPRWTVFQGGYNSDPKVDMSVYKIRKESMVAAERKIEVVIC